jgi:hypothetical protein
LARTAFAGRDWWFHSVLPNWLDATMAVAAGEVEQAAELLERALRRTIDGGTILWA